MFTNRFALFHFNTNNHDCDSRAVIKANGQKQFKPSSVSVKALKEGRR